MMRYVPLQQWAAPVVPADLPFSEVSRAGFLPLADSELLLSSHYYPLAVRFDDGDLAVGAIIQPDMLARALVNASGRWSGAYIPIALRCFPLRLARSPTGDPHADLEVATVKSTAQPKRLIRVTGTPDEPLTDLQALYDGLKSVWDGQLRMRAGVDMLLIGDLLAPINASTDIPGPLCYTVDRHRASKLTNRALEAMARKAFNVVDLLTAITFSQAHLRPDLRPLQIPVGSTSEGAAAETAIGVGIDTVTPWLDTSELFPGNWAADPSVWSSPSTPPG